MKRHDDKEDDEEKTAETKKSIVRCGDWQQFFSQTELSRTHQDWFDPHNRKKTTPVRSQRKGNRTKILDYNHNLLRAHPDRRTHSSGPEVQMPPPPVVSTTRFEEYQHTANTQQVGYNTLAMMYNPNLNMVHKPMPPSPMRGPMPGPSAYDHHRPTPWSQWPPPSRQHLPVQIRRTSPRFDPMAKPTYIDDPRRRPRK